MLMSLVAALIIQSAAVPHPATPQRVSGRQSGYVQGTLNVALGERVTMRRNADGTYDLIQVDRISPMDVLPPEEGTRDAINKAPVGTVRFALHARQDIGSILKVENGQSVGLRYIGFIAPYRGGRARPPEPTSVCTVPAGMANFEHWQEPVVQVVIADLGPSDDSLPVCPPQT